MRSVFMSLFLFLDRSATARHLRAIRAGVLDRAAMEELLFTLDRKGASVPDRHLWWLTEVIEVRSDPGEGCAVKGLLFNLYRSANWELQNRYRTV